MNDLEKRKVELLEEILKWTKIANFEKVKSVIEGVLNNEKKLKVYELTGEKKQTEIAEELKMSTRDISAVWQECERRGFLVKRGKRYEKKIDLADFGLAPTTSGKEDEGNATIEPEGKENDEG